MKYVAYYRVSTRQQGESGLGLEAQRETVRRHLQPTDELVAEYTEIESGKNDRRPKLLQAIDLAKKEGATLLIAKLDRLSRSAAFTIQLRDSDVPFIACDMKGADRTTIGIIAVINQEEARRISQRTKEALAAKAARGETWERHKLTDEARRMGQEARRMKALENSNNKLAAELARLYRQQGKGYKAIADILNRNGHRTSGGNMFHPMSVKRLLLMPFAF